VIRVAVAGAAGRMGLAVCTAVEGADDMQLTGRADPLLGSTLAEVLPDADVVVDFTHPETALENALVCVRAGVHAVVGTTGFDLSELERACTAEREGRAAGGGERAPANVLVAPNFAIGAVLMMRFAAEAARHMAKAEIIELHHDRKLDAPSGTAALTARLMAAASGGGSGPVPTGGGSEPAPPGGIEVGGIPIHSVRLPGLVAHQEVIFGDLGQTLTIRHDSLDRESFMPGVLLAVRRIAALARPLTVGLESLLFETGMLAEGECHPASAGDTSDVG
jgi:4-hydroxy-tetrahydrodipicolinate reductase